MRMQLNLNLNLCYQLMITQDILKMKLSSLYSLYKVKQLYRKLIKKKKERKLNNYVTILTSAASSTH